MAAGESTLERVEQVEDSKANSGEPGCLILTNLRLIWYSAKTARLNLSEFYYIVWTNYVKAYFSIGIDSQPWDTIL